VPSRFSRTGIFLCAVYLIAVAVCVGMATSASDPKGSYVLLQLPLALQFAFLDAIGALRYFAGLSWPTAYAVLGLPTLVFLYYAGAVMESMLRSLERMGRSGP
jgi:hypothetical protein